MRPVDPRLLRCSRAARLSIGGAVLCGIATVILVVAQATLLSHIVARAAFAQDGVAALSAAVTALATVVVLRCLVGWIAEVTGRRGAAAVISQLRVQLLAHLLRLGPAHLDEARTGELTTVATSGLDALDPYFARYLPQLVLAAVLPVAVIAWITRLDLVAAITLAATVPLIPVFAALIGLGAERSARSRHAALATLGAHFLDVVQGLPTLRVFGRSHAQIERIREVTDRYRTATMATLRVAFLSSLVLETLSTLGVALVAVAIGVRLVDGGMGFEQGFTVLVLAPEVYLPLRQVGSQFHASTEGIAAADRVFGILAEPVRAAERVSAPSVVTPDLATAVIRFEAVDVEYPSRPGRALSAVDLVLPPRASIAVVGPSGAGKSTVLAVLLRFIEPSAGRVTIGDVELCSLPAAQWRRSVAWVPQRARLLTGTLGDNVRLGRAQASDDDLLEALTAAGADGLLARLPAGLRTPIGENGARLSAGERQRVALARALLRDAPLLILDEPDANLDPRSRASLHAALARAAASRTTLVVTHDPAEASWVDEVVVLRNGRIAEHASVRRRVAAPSSTTVVPVTQPC